MWFNLCYDSVIFPWKFQVGVCVCSLLPRAQLYTQERGARDVRARAQAALEDMTPASLFRCGLTCDYTMECLTFLRDCFDIDDPDPATTKQSVLAFCARMKMLFIDGFILGDASKVAASQAAPATPTAPATPAAADVASMTATQMVFEQVDFPEPSLGLKIESLSFRCGPNYPQRLCLLEFSCMHHIISGEDLLWEQNSLSLHKGRCAGHTQHHG